MRAVGQNVPEPGGPEPEGLVRATSRPVSSLRDTGESQGWPSPIGAECGPWASVDSGAWPGTRTPGGGAPMELCVGLQGSPPCSLARVWLVSLYSPLGDTMERAGPEQTPAPCGSPSFHPSVSRDESPPELGPRSTQGRSGLSGTRRATWPACAHAPR